MTCTSDWKCWVTGATLQAQPAWSICFSRGVEPDTKQRLACRCAKGQPPVFWKTWRLRPRRVCMFTVCSLRAADGIWSDRSCANQRNVCYFHKRLACGSSLTRLKICPTCSTMPALCTVQLSDGARLRQQGTRRTLWCLWNSQAIFLPITGSCEV